MDRTKPKVMSTEKDFLADEMVTIDTNAEIGKGAKTWHFSHVMSNYKIGERCKIGQNVAVSQQIVLGKKVEVQNDVSIYTGVVGENHALVVGNPAKQTAWMSEFGGRPQFNLNHTTSCPKHSEKCQINNNKIT